MTDFAPSKHKVERQKEQMAIISIINNLSDSAGCCVSCGKSTFSPHHKRSFALVRTLFTRYTLYLRFNAIRDDGVECGCI